ncbi:MAG: hypothetical protein DRR06_03420 [Gammaproteobacteria bacterium]|nr:MAG: hypothetical protein DRR06_03420 [Gammaproteobacteria bacterium]RLA50506.1 MAG: hypothetical protein DRR42_12950 [Gammaproteobacteria bacterium]
MATADIEARVKKMGEGDTLTISRAEFRDACDEDDKVVYLTVARRMGRANKKWVTIEEDDFIFGPPPAK